MTRRRIPPPRRQPVWFSAVLRRVETGADGYEYEVRPVAGSRAVKTYRCPGCDHEIRSGTSHVVVWPVELGHAGRQAGIADRRHWHSHCWSHRVTRRPTRR
ncbi:MAG: hypothetical protein K2Q25_03405 [Mycobacteriaceae bacterium]|nr:hypothetical protein [Mycobacteriaceae bacterium]